MENKRILVAALNWGLGHATRCIPIISELDRQGYEPLIASDGQALELLKKEFPKHRHIELPSYNIEYSEKASALKWKLMLKTPKILRVIQEEKNLTRDLVKKFQLHGIISDNRWGIRSEELDKNVFITHQLKVLSGNTTPLSSFVQSRYIAKYQQCWVPDVAGETNLSGELGHPEIIPNNVKYIGNLSRFTKTNSRIMYDYLVLLSGPEPQRTMLEAILLKELINTDKKVLFVRGVITEENLESYNPNLNIRNYLYGEQLEAAINASRYLICRSGYTTLMDLSKLGKKAFLIPTPGQPEQEYLAKRMQALELAPYCAQDNFSLQKLEKIEKYAGLGDFGDHPFIGDCLAFFEGK